MVIEINAAVQSVLALSKMVQAGYVVGKTTEIDAAAADALSKLSTAWSAALTAHQEQVTLAKRVGELEKEIAELKDWKQEAERYQLINTGMGTFAYCLKPGMEQGDPPHHLCAHCYNDNKKSILQFFITSYDNIERSCHRCKSENTISFNEAMRLFPELIKT